MSRPNFLFIMTDQYRWDAMSCSGDWVQTPNIDRIAAEGVRFANAVTNSPVCIPARACLATGLYPWNLGIWNNCHFDMPADTPTWWQCLKTAGYRTCLIGKTHMHHHSGDLRDRLHLMHAYGLDDVDEIGGPRASANVRSNMTEDWEKKGKWQAYQVDYVERFSKKPHMVRPSTLGEEDYADTYVGRQAETYLRTYNRAEPWFCWASFGGPHEPWDTPEPWASKYDPAAMPKARPAPESREDRPQGSLDRIMARPPDLSEEDVAAMRADYAGNCSMIDAWVGRLLAAVEARGEMDNTVVVFCSDHGEMNGDAGLIYKSQMLESAVRVPLIIRTPETAKAAGFVHQAPVEWLDLGATVVDLAGATYKHRQHAKSLVPLLSNPAARVRPGAVSGIDHELMWLDESCKCVVNQQGEVYLLFHRESDPEEQVNLAGDPAWAQESDSIRRQLLGRVLSCSTPVRNEA